MIFAACPGILQRRGEVVLEYADEGTTKRSNVSKYLAARADEAAAILREGGLFRAQIDDGGDAGIRVRALTKEDSLTATQLERLGSSLNRTAAAVSLA